MSPFPQLSYDRENHAWTGWCRLPVFAEFGKLAPDDHRLAEPTPEFLRGEFELTVQDHDGAGPSAEQSSAFRHLVDHEADVCRAVLTELVNACDMRGGMLAWLQARRDTRLWGWLARLFGPEYKTPEDLRQAARCIGVEISSAHIGSLAYIAFKFETVFGIEVEHGLSVVFHPEQEATWGDASAIYEMS